MGDAEKRSLSQALCPMGELVQLKEGMLQFFVFLLPSRKYL